jgi:nucleoside-diphosphate-sugar epimerase
MWIFTIYICFQMEKNAEKDMESGDLKMAKTVLITGGTGRFGRHAAHAFAQAGWAVKQFDRKTGNLENAARGVDVIVNAGNPEYPDWAAQVPEITRKTIAAAKSSGAMVIIPGNVYVFGADAPEMYGVDTPHRATNGLGRVRIAMERAYRESGVKTVILRAGDFIDTRASGNWFDMMMVPKLDKGKFIYPGDPDTLHAWAWLPDLARAAVMLAERRDRLPVFSDVPFEGYSLTGNGLCTAISTATGRAIKLNKMNWLPLIIARPFWPMARYLLEMRYAWSKPHRLSGAVLEELLPEFTATPLLHALRQIPGVMGAGN